MYREVIETVRNKIIADVTEFNEVLLWNNQVDSMEVSEERSYNFPNCFIGFQVPAVLKDESTQVQQTRCTLMNLITECLT